MIPPLTSNTMNGEDLLGMTDKSNNQKSNNKTDNNNEGGRPEKQESEKSEKTIQNQESMS